MSDGYIQILDREKYFKIIGGMSNYRIDNFIREAEANEGANKGVILSFVRGLRLSSLLTYQIRQLLDGSDFTANWGHIIDENGAFCSRECDIIIHSKNIPLYQWDGDGAGNHIMDFRFIPYYAAKVVISCKSFLTTAKIEEDYCNDMLKYVDRVWLFSECCGPKSDEKIEERAKEIGYEDFWYLYKWNRGNNELTQTIEVWDSFVESVKALR
jgi:hypothetical protein